MHLQLRGQKADVFAVIEDAAFAHYNSAAWIWRTGGRCPHPSKFHVSPRADDFFRTEVCSVTLCAACTEQDLQKSERKGKGLNVGYLCWLNVGLMLV